MSPMLGRVRARHRLHVPSPAAALLTGECLIVFHFAAHVALAASAHLAASLLILVAAGRPPSSSSSPRTALALRRFVASGPGRK
uniref:Uncharacterized protein n=1 Tax=Zea mays TaxID=4577 RepID=B6TN17_MAIZE|nr:hypothetical protein [Zea mays]